jgi:hypothetical protein
VLAEFLNSPHLAPASVIEPPVGTTAARALRLTPQTPASKPIAPAQAVKRSFSKPFFFKTASLLLAIDRQPLDGSIDACRMAGDVGIVANEVRAKKSIGARSRASQGPRIDGAS